MNTTGTAGAAPCRLRCEYRENPLGIDVRVPRLSWQMAPRDARGLLQTAYQIEVAASPDGLDTGHGMLWDSGRVVSGDSLHRPYGGPALRSGQRCYWHVRTWDNAGHGSLWSEPACWEMGLLDAAAWQAKWIEPDWDEDPKASQPSPYLRATFSLKGKVKSARVYATAHGLYELTLNGHLAGDDVFTPGFTAYEKRLQYQTYDVTTLLQEGENVAGAILGDGWWRGKVGAASVRNTYGTRLALLVQINIVYDDGSEDLVTTGEGWKATTGPILALDLKDGETYDARREMPGWDAPGFDDGQWRGVQVAPFGHGNLVAADGVPVRRHEEIRPVRIIRTPAGETVFDMGQNFAGRVRLHVQGPAGTTVTLQHGEALDKAGNFTMKNLEMPAPMGEKLLQRDTYILKGDSVEDDSVEDDGVEGDSVVCDGVECYEPRFTFHGFRYVKVEGFPGQPGVENLTGIAIYSDMAPTGTFACSDPAINQLQHNITWSQKSNFLDIPTDCPRTRAVPAGRVTHRSSRGPAPLSWTRLPFSRSGLRTSRPSNIRTAW